MDSRPPELEASPAAHDANRFRPPGAVVADIGPGDAGSGIARRIVIGLVALQLLMAIRHAPAYVLMVSYGVWSAAGLLLVLIADICLWVGAFRLWRGNRRRGFFVSAAVCMAMAFWFSGLISLPIFFQFTDLSMALPLALAGAWLSRPAPAQAQERSDPT